MIGDSLRDDVSVSFSVWLSTDLLFSSPFVHTSSFLIIQVGCGKQAGAFTCLLDETGRYNSEHYANMDLEPDFKVSTLGEVLHLLNANFELAP